MTIPHTIESMLHSGLDNYAIPGLTSYMVGGPEHGRVRLFECSRQHQEAITPHSHRFDFSCLVLSGFVRNVHWVETQDEDADEFQLSTLTYDGEPGEYTSCTERVAKFHPLISVHRTGEWYSMNAEEIHSIFFDRGTKVLFFEGPTKSDTSLILEPFVNGLHVQTFDVANWMFQARTK